MSNTYFYNDKDLTPVNYLLEKFSIETYDDFAHTLSIMSEAAEEMLNNSKLRPDLYDDVESHNLDTLKDLLKISSTLFRDCDPYYRRKLN